MKKKTFFVPVLVLAFLVIAESRETAFTATRNVMTCNSIRIAYYQHGEAIGTGKVDAFLDRAKKNSYNYVLTPFYMGLIGDRNEPAGFKVNAAPSSSPMEKKEDFRMAFKKAEEKGLRLIPEIQMGDAHAGHWKYAQQNWNRRITMTLVTMADGRELGCHAFSAEPEGIDKTFIDLLKVIAEAHKEAAVSHPLEFVHIGHDEPAYGSWLIMGDCRTGKSDSSNAGYYCGSLVSWNVARVPEKCAADRNYLERHTGTKTEAVQSLLVAEIYRRVCQVQSVFGTQTKVMVFGDMWDPQFYFQRYYTWNGDRVTPSPGLCDLPGLSAGEKKLFRKNVILMPWTYDLCAGPAAGALVTNYDARAVFSHFSSKGFKFIWTHTITENPTNGAQAMAYNLASGRFKSHCLGYCAASWDDSYADPPQKSFTILENLSRRNKTTMPKKDFR